MLVLTRANNDLVYILVPASNQDRLIQVMTVETRYDKVRLGFKADDDVLIHRQEVFEAIQRGEKRHGDRD
jgi:carbon storage regulator CsrA